MSFAHGLRPEFGFPNGLFIYLKHPNKLFFTVITRYFRNKISSRYISLRVTQYFVTVKSADYKQRHHIPHTIQNGTYTRDHFLVLERWRIYV